MDENFTRTFADTYLDDLPEDESGKDEETLKIPKYTAKAFSGMHKTLRVRGELNLDGDNSQLLHNAVKLLDSAEKSQSEAQKERLKMMCALIRLVCAMEWATKESPEGVCHIVGFRFFLYEEVHN